MNQVAPKLITVGVIAQKVGVPFHRVVHVLRTRDHIKPAAYAGRTRLYRADAIAQVRHELNTMDARRSEGVA